MRKGVTTVLTQNHRACAKRMSLRHRPGKPERGNARACVALWLFYKQPKRKIVRARLSSGGGRVKLVGWWCAAKAGSHIGSDSCRGLMEPSHNLFPALALQPGRPSGPVYN